jgi:hypothetical protein
MGGVGTDECRRGWSRNGRGGDFTAATDGTDQLRYVAGEDARQFESQRDSQDDAIFFAGMRALFGQ